MLLGVISHHDVPVGQCRVRVCVYDTSSFAVQFGRSANRCSWLAYRAKSCYITVYWSETVLRRRSCCAR